MKMRYVNWICRAIWAGFLAWILFAWLCRPVVALHYSAKATASIGFYFESDENRTKRGLAPGESVWLPTAMNPPSDMLVMLSFPFDSKDVLHVKEPFSRIDVYIGPGARIEWTETRHGFFSRFTNPSFHAKWKR
ncbi:hypothetical protein [Achromobacter arsenitoxydans]|nr:hypothetical protein [Achromobacter arsenitoxydans]